MQLHKPIYEMAVGVKEQIGTITLYYDESLIVKQIEQLKQTTTKKIQEFNKVIDKKLFTALWTKFLINLISLLIILLLITFLLKKFVNRPLKILQNGLDDFFMFLQNKKDNAKTIIIQSNDEFGQMAKQLNENISVSAKLHEEIHELNINLEKMIQERTKKITTLLNNAGQGFLTFKINFLVDDEYSKECEKLLGGDIAHKDIAKLLFEDETKSNIFKENILDMLSTPNPIAKKAIISLLPNEIILNKRALKLEYKVLSKVKFPQLNPY